MKIRIELTNDRNDKLTHDITVEDTIEVDHTTTSALIKLLRNSWSVAPGDSIKIMEV